MASLVGTGLILMPIIVKTGGFILILCAAGLASAALFLKVLTLLLGMHHG